MRLALLAATIAIAALTAGPVAQAHALFQPYKHPALSAQLLQKQLSAGKGYKEVKVTVFNPTLLIANGLAFQKGWGWIRFRVKLYKVSTYRLLGFYSFIIPPGSGEWTTPSPGYIDTKYAN